MEINRGKASLPLPLPYSPLPSSPSSSSRSLPPSRATAIACGVRLPLLSPPFPDSTPLFSPRGSSSSFSARCGYRPLSLWNMTLIVSMVNFERFSFILRLFSFQCLIMEVLGVGGGERVRLSVNSCRFSIGIWSWSDICVWFDIRSLFFN